MANRYLTYGKQLSDLGYDVTPLKGKIPILKGWQQRPETAEDFTKHKSANIGLVTGGKYNVVAVDIDVKHQGAVNIIRTLTDDLLGSAPERIGNAPKTMFVFRCSEPFKKVKTAVYDIDGEDACVEVLAEGQQFVASGKHPDTKKNYSWPHDNLLEIAPTSLTEITPEDINNFIITCNTALNDYGKVKSHSLTSNNTSNSNSKYEFAENEQTTTADKLLAAMAYIPNEDLHYDDWTMVAHAIKGAIGAEGNDLFHRWSSRSDKYDSAETDRLWDSIGEVKTIGAGSIFHMANQNGFDVATWDAPLGPEDIDEFDTAPDASVVTEDWDTEEDEDGDGCFTAASVKGPIPPREWALDQWFPYKAAAMLFGAGGIGKTLLMHQLGNCVAMGSTFMGIETKQMPVLLALCEDDKQELQRRQLDINDWIGDEFTSAPDNCHLWPRVGKENVLVTFPSHGEDQAGAFYEKICRKIQEIKDLHKSDDIFVVLDTAADFFGGNEVVRRETNTFIKKYLGSLCVKYNATVVLLAHPSLAGIASGTGSSGSTAWENSVRARAYLSRVEDSEELLVLTRKKSNYSAVGRDSDITLIWDKGVIVIPSSPDQVDRIAQTALKREIMAQVDVAWGNNNGIKKSGNRGYKKVLPSLIKGHKQNVLTKVFEELDTAGNLAYHDKKGYYTDIELNKAQVYGN